MTLDDLKNSRWEGTGELWLDPLGNQAQTSPCTLHVEPNGLRYEWEYEGTPHQGSIVLDAGVGVFTDSWHSPAPMRFTPAGKLGLFDLQGSYAAGDGPPWGWRIILSLRPPANEDPETLVLQMTNITPWGEEVRAVRMMARRSPS